MWEWESQAAITVADYVRRGCLVVGLCYAAATFRLLRDPWIRIHPTWPGFRVRLVTLALGVVVVVILQYERVGEPVHFVLLPLSIAFLLGAFYSVWLPVSNVRELTERRLREL